MHINENAWNKFSKRVALIWRLNCIEMCNRMNWAVTAEDIGQENQEKNKNSDAQIPNFFADKKIKEWRSQVSILGNEDEKLLEGLGKKLHIIYECSCYETFHHLASDRILVCLTTRSSSFLLVIFQKDIWELPLRILFFFYCYSIASHAFSDFAIIRHKRGFISF